MTFGDSRHHSIIFVRHSIQFIDIFNRMYLFLIHSSTSFNHCLLGFLDANFLQCFCPVLLALVLRHFHVWHSPPFPLAASVYGAGLEKRRREQLKWSLAFRLYIRSFPCAQLPGPVHTARLGRMFFFVFSLGLCFVCVFICAFWFVYMSPFFYVFLSSWVISLTVFGASETNLNEPPRALAASTIAWVRS